MSVKNDEQTKKLEEEVVVNEVETTEVIELDKEAKKAEMVEVAKKVLKVAGIAAVGIVGFLLGHSTASKNEYDNPEVIDVDCKVIETDEE